MFSREKVLINVMGKKKRSVEFLVSMILLLSLCLATTSHAREITDMAGRRVGVPDTIRKVCTDWPIMMYLVYALDPALLAGLNTPFTDDQKRYLAPSVARLPVIGGFYSKTRVMNMETFLKVKPDVVIAELYDDMSLNAKVEAMLSKNGIPVVYVKVDTTRDYPEAFLFLGKLLGREKRARALSNYGKTAFSEIERVVASLSQNRKRLRVYYAEGATGLFTECQTSFHAELIELIGAENVHFCSRGGFKVKGKEAVNLEQVLRYDPDVIIAAEPLFYRSVLRDGRWQNIKAVKNRRIYLPPRLLFNWFDRPPSFMRLLGMKWLAHSLYPDAYRIDIVKEAQAFYRLFLHVDVSADIMRKAVYP